MKAAVVTFVRAYNYGAVLQCYALCRTLEKLGVDAQTIDYYPECFRKLYGFSYLGEPRYIPYRPIKNWLNITPVWFKLKKRNDGFDRFIKTHIPITPKQYSSFEMLNDEVFDYDLYISGSDQVWSYKCADFDPTFFLQFNSAKNAKKASYAASFGFSVLADRVKSDYKERLINWNAYSVREESGKGILKDLLNIDATRSCDPTLLLDKAEWDKIRKDSKVKNDYILIYSVNACAELYEYAKILSKEKNLKVIYVPCVAHHDFLMGNVVKKFGFETIGAASPDEWLDLFSKASYVLTDSFHGTVFSIIYRKKFMTIVDFSWGKNHRAMELIDSLNIKGRALKDDFMDLIDEPINWEDVDSRMLELRTGALEYLNSLKNLEG